MNNLNVKTGWLVVIDARVNDDDTPIIESWIQEHSSFEDKIKEILQNFKENTDYYKYSNDNMCGGFTDAILLQDGKIAKELSKHCPYIQAGFGEIDEMFYLEIPEQLKEFVSEAVSVIGSELPYIFFYSDEFIAIKKKEYPQEVIHKILKAIEDFARETIN